LVAKAHDAVADVRGVYAKRLMHCLDYNYDRASLEEPLFFVLPFAGTDLERYFSNLSFNVTIDKLGSIFKQVYQGLDLMAHMDPPLIHHDLHYGNIAVKEVHGEPVVHIIDFGCAIEGTTEMQHIDCGTMKSFAPPEYAQKNVALPAHSFDIYFFAQTLAWLLIGASFNSLKTNRVLGEFEEPARERNITDWHSIGLLSTTISSEEFFLEYLPVAAEFGRPGLAQMSEHNETEAFVALWLKCMCLNPKKRPSPAQMLETAWLRKASSP
jgi:serine/threonine protein kinase